MSRRIIQKIEPYNKIDVISFVKMKIKDNSDWAKGSCLAIYGQQEEREKKNHLSHGHNGCGFGRNDSPKLTKIACRLNQHRETIEDIIALKNLMPRYAAQIICLSNKKKLKMHLDMYYKPRMTKYIPF